MFSPRRPRASFAARPVRVEDRSLPLQLIGNEPQPASPARLAAEALFEVRGPEPVLHEPVPVVVVRRRKAVAADEALAASSQTVAGGGHPALRRARVFTLRPAAVQPAAVPAAPAVAGAERPRRRSRADRIGHDTRARVIRHVSLANGAAAPQAAPPNLELSAHPALDSAATLGTAEPTAAELAAGLAALDRLFADIRQAQSFTFADVSAAADWLRLAAAIDRLTRELQAMQG